MTIKKTTFAFWVGLVSSTVFNFIMVWAFGVYGAILSFINGFIIGALLAIMLPKYYEYQRLKSAIKSEFKTTIKQ